MRTKRVWRCTLIILYHAVLAMSIQCPTNYRPYTCSSTACSCVLVSKEDTGLDFSSASTACSDGNGGHLALIGEDYDRQVIQRYIEVLAADSSELYWVGYRYADSVTLLDVNGQPASAVLTDSNNFDSNTQASNDSCVAIGGDGLFRNVLCDNALLYVCSVDYTDPGVVATSAPARFVPDGETVTLTCSFEGTAISRSVWFYNGMEIRNTATVTVTGDASMLIVNFVFDSSLVGDYHCLVENPFGTVLSQVVRLEQGVDSGETAPTINQLTVTVDAPLDNTAVHSITLGDPIVLTCEVDMPVTFSWLRNGEELVDSADPTDPVLINSMNGMTSTLDISSFQQSGIYQCQVRTGTNYHAIASIALGATDGTPGPIEFLFASPESQSEVIIGWVAPQFANTQDLLLLRYQVLYSTDPSAPVSRTPMLLPSADNADDEVKVEQTTLGGLETGTKYTVSLVAHSLAGEGMLSQFMAAVTTYGNVPTAIVTLSRVERTPDNTTVVVEWQSLITSLPTGNIATYEIEYRDAGQITSNRGLVLGNLNFFVLSGLADANDYEVRVRACIEITSEPDYDCTLWTGYYSVEGITTDIPPTTEAPSPVPPTTESVRENSNDVDVVVPAVVVPVSVLVLIIVLVALYFCYVRSRSGKMDVSTGGRGRTESSVGLTTSRDTEKPPPITTSEISV